MRLLLDTHTLVWFLNGDPQISPTARLAIETDRNECFVSYSSIWEIAIKNCLGKLELTRPFRELQVQLEENGLEIWPLEFHHFLLVNQLPLHHRDPFDRLLISQALADDLTLVSKDLWFPSYGVKVLW